VRQCPTNDLVKSQRLNANHQRQSEIDPDAGTRQYLFGAWRRDIDIRRLKYARGRAEITTAPEVSSCRNLPRQNDKIRFAALPGFPSEVLIRYNE
jgi:hypothetical protein